MPPTPEHPRVICWKKFSDKYKYTGRLHVVNCDISQLQTTTALLSRQLHPNLCRINVLLHTIFPSFHCNVTTYNLVVVALSIHCKEVWYINWTRDGASRARKVIFPGNKAHSFLQNANACRISYELVMSK